MEKSPSRLVFGLMADTFLFISIATFLFQLDQIRLQDSWSGFWYLRVPCVLIIPGMLIRLASFWGFDPKKDLFGNSHGVIGFIITVSVLQFFLKDIPAIRLVFGFLFLSMIALRFFGYLKVMMAGIEFVSPRVFGKFFFLGFLWFYGSYASWIMHVRYPTGDEPHYLMMTHSLIHDMDINLWDEYQNEEYSGFYPGNLVPKPSDIHTDGFIKSIGLGPTFSAILIPAYGLGGYTGTVVFMVFITSLLVLQTYRLILDLDSPRKTACWASTLLGIVPPILIYSNLVYPDMLSALIIISCVRLLHRDYRRRQEPVFLLVVMTLCFILLLLKFRFFPVVLLLMAGGISKIHQRALKTFKIGGLALALIMVYFALDAFVLKGDLFGRRFGDLYRIKHYLPSWDSLTVIPGFLLDAEAGILFISPALLLVFTGIRLFRIRKKLTFILCALSAPLTILTLMGHFAWHSMPTPPLRYLLPVIPITWVFGSQVIQNWKHLKPSIQLIASFFIIYSVIISVLFSINPDWQVNFADGTPKIFESLSHTIHIPITQYLPSLTRPGRSLLFWIPFMLLLIAALTRSPMKAAGAKKSHVWGNRHAVVTVGFWSLCFLAAWQLPVHHIQMEDLYLSNPSDGYFYPRIKDPFFHREKTYGWELPPGALFQPRFSTGAGEWSFLIRAKLTGAVSPSRLTIHYGSSSTVVTIYSPDWRNHLAVIDRPDDDQNWIIESSTDNRAEIVVDEICVFRPEQDISSTTKTVLNSFARLPFPSLERRLLSRAMRHSSGSVIEAIRRYADPRTIQRTSRPGHIPPDYKSIWIPRYFHGLLDADMEEIIREQELLGFSFDRMVEKSKLRDYVIFSLQAGKPVRRRLLNRLLEWYPDDLELSLSVVAEAYLNKDTSRTVDQLSEIIENHPVQGVTLTNPGNYTAVLPRSAWLFENMLQDPEFQKQANHKLEHYWIESVQAYHRGNLNQSIQSLHQLYLLDNKQFIELLISSDESYLQKIIPYIASINHDDAILIISELLKTKRFRSAFLLNEQVLKQNPKSLPVRLLMARTLFHIHRYEEAWQQCIMAMNLDFADDRARMLLNTIRRVAGDRSLNIGLAPDRIP